MKLVKTEEVKNNDLQKKMEELEKELEKKRSELEDKSFLIEYSKDDIYELRLFLQKKAKWTSLQALGIIETIKALDEAENQASKLKDMKGIMMKNIPIEAIAYFLSKHEDVGYDYAVTFANIAKPIYSVRDRLIEIRKKYDEIKNQIAQIEYAIKNGVDIEKETENLEADEQQ